MDNKQVVTVGPTGSLSGLQLKGRGVDLRKFGHAQIKRISEIVWIDNYQAWCVKPKRGVLKDLLLSSLNVINTAGIGFSEVGSLLMECNAKRPFWGTRPLPFRFDEYEEAVKFEVAFIQWCMLNGKSHLIK